ncbi:MAG: hypothetical protein R3C03_22995 [Pirellulaceae bacterium]
MKSYQNVRSTLESCFSIQAERSEEDEKAAYMREYYANPDLRLEIKNLFLDESVNWRELLFNKNYEVYEADSEEEAREFAREILIQYPV